MTENSAREGGEPAGEVYDWYVRGPDPAGGRQPGGGRGAAPRMPSSAEPESASVLEALARALFDARRYGEAAELFAELAETQSRQRLRPLRAGPVPDAARRPDRRRSSSWRWPRRCARDARSTSRRCARPARRSGPGRRPAWPDLADLARRPARRGPAGVTTLVAGSDSPLATRHDVGAARPRRRALRRPGRGARRAARCAGRAAGAGCAPRSSRTTRRGRRRRWPRTCASSASPAETDDVVTSAQAAATLVAAGSPPGRAVLVVGGEGLVAALDERGLRPCTDRPTEVGGGRAGLRPGRRLASAGRGRVRRRGRACRGSPATWTPPSRRRAASPRATAPGRRHRADHRAAAGRGRRQAGDAAAPRSRCGAPVREHPLVVGDRLDTDIEGANRAGCPACWCSPVSRGRPTCCAPGRRSGRPTSGG